MSKDRELVFWLLNGSRAAVALHFVKKERWRDKASKQKRTSQANHCFFTFSQSESDGDERIFVLEWAWNEMNIYLWMMLLLTIFFYASQLPLSIPHQSTTSPFPFSSLPKCILPPLACHGGPPLPPSSSSSSLLLIRVGARWCISGSDSMRGGGSYSCRRKYGL